MDSSTRPISVEIISVLMAFQPVFSIKFEEKLVKDLKEINVSVHPVIWKDVIVEFHGKKDRKNTMFVNKNMSKKLF